MPLADELSGLVRLAFPVMVSRAGLLVMTTVDTVMTGWAGGDELAYLAIGLAPFVFLMLVGTGLLTGTVVLVAQARGPARPRRAAGSGIWPCSMPRLTACLSLRLLSAAKGSSWPSGQTGRR